MPRRKSQDKRRREKLTLQEWLYVSGGPRMTRRDGNDGRAEWQAWNEAHGRAYRFQRGCPHNGDLLSAFEVLTGERTLHIPTAQREVERLLHEGIGGEELALDVEHPDPPGFEQVYAG